MPEQNESPYTRSGRLFAALAVLRLAAGTDTTPATPDDHSPKDHPQGRIDRLALKPAPYDLLTRSRTGTHWPAAAEAFRRIPDFLDAGPAVTGPMTEKGLVEHKAGYEDQMALFREKFPDLPL